MFPVYLLIGLINIFAKHSNYGIDLKDPDFDVRVRRSLQDNAPDNALNIPNYIGGDLKSDNYNKYVPKHNYTNEDNNSTEKGENSHIWHFLTRNKDTSANGTSMSMNKTNAIDTEYNIWNYLMHTTRRFIGNHNYGNNITNLPRYNTNGTFRRIPPFRYPTRHIPKAKVTLYKHITPGYNHSGGSPGYSHANSNVDTPHFYNYQDPKRQNFAGYFGYNASISGYKLRNNTGFGYDNSFYRAPMPYKSNSNNGDYNYNLQSPYAPGYIPKPNSNLDTKVILAPYPPDYTPRINNLNNLSEANYNNPGPYAPEYAPNPGNNAGYIAYNNTVQGYHRPAPVTTEKTVTTTEVKIACIICNIGCPKFMRRLGSFCGKRDEDDI